MHLSVIILRGQTRQSDRHISQLQQFFAQENFLVTVMGGSIIDCLKHSQSKWPNLPCLIIRDGSIPLPGLTAELLLEHLQELYSRQIAPKIIHLCRWNDVCYKNISITPNWYYSHQPLEIQATIFQPAVIIEILAAHSKTDPTTRQTTQIATQIATQTIHQTIAQIGSPVVVPKYNLFNFDSGLSITDADFQRANLCQPIPDESTTSGILGLVLIIAAIMGIVLILLISYLNNREEDWTISAMLLGILLILVFVGFVVTLVLISD